MVYSTLKRGGQLRRRSVKRQREDEAMGPLRAACFERDGRCMAPIAWGRCFGPWTPHHVVTRARDREAAASVQEETRTLFWCVDCWDDPSEVALWQYRHAGVPAPQRDEKA